MRLFAIAFGVAVVLACGGSVNSGLDGGGDSGAAAVQCGASSCASGESCCVDVTQQPQSFTCATTCPWPADTLGCAGNDCGPTQVCCVFQLQDSTDVHSECRPNCLGNDVAQLCRMDAQNTGCPANAPCENSNIDTWWLDTPFGTCGDASCCGF